MVDTSMFASIQSRAPAWRRTAAGACLFGVSPPSWSYSRPLPCWFIFVAKRRVTHKLARAMRLRLPMRHLQSHRSSLLNFEEAAYYKYCITRPFHLSDPVLRGGRTAPPSLTVPFTTCGGLGARGPYEGCSLYEKKLGRTRGVKRILFYQISTVSACGTARTARGKNETVRGSRCSACTHRERITHWRGGELALTTSVQNRSGGDTFSVCGESGIR